MSTINSSLAQPVQVKTQQALSHDDEPLLHFSFAKFLADPCGLIASSSSPTTVTVDHNAPPSQTETVTSSSTLSPPPTDLSQEALDFIGPFRQHYNLNSSLFTTEERVVLIEEFLQVLQEVKYRTRASCIHDR